MTERRNNDSPIVPSHEGLQPPDDDERRCDVCGAALRPLHEDDEQRGYDVPGQGVYLWTRGDEVRFEKVPLCAPCASAIGMRALGRWEIEEEEG